MTPHSKLRPMLRAFALALVAGVALAAAPGPAAAAYPDEVALQGQLASTADALAAADRQVAEGQARVDATQARIASERAQVAGLARAIYVQPDSTLVTIAAAPTLGDALLRVADLMSAAQRAAQAKVALEADLRRLASEQQALAQHRDELARNRDAAAAQYAALVARHREEAAAAAAAAAPPAGPGPAPAAGSVEQLILGIWAPLGDRYAQWAVRLARCESGLDPNALNRSSGAAGLFQFLPRTWAGTPYAAQSPFDAAANTRAAMWLYQKYGAGQWSCTARIGYP